MSELLYEVKTYADNSFKVLKTESLTRREIIMRYCLPGGFKNGWLNNCVHIKW